MLLVKEQQQTKSNYRKWTKKEEEKLASIYGTKSIYSIARILNRNPSGVLNKIKRMKLSSSNEYQGLINITQFSKILNVHASTINVWIRNREFPYTRRVTAFKHSYILIDVDEFWEWAEKNKDVVDFSKIQPQILLPEPEWFQVEREIDKKTSRKGKRYYTKEEDELIWNLYYNEKLNYKNIAQRLDRPEGSVSKRLSRLRIKRDTNIAN